MMGNRRPSVKGSRIKDIKAAKPQHQPLVEDLTPKKVTSEESKTNQHEKPSIEVSTHCSSILM